MTEKPVPPLVLVVWEDAKVVADGPWTENKDRPYEPHLVYQVGFLLKDTKQGVQLTQAWHPDLISPPDQIPRGMIRSVTYLQPGEKPARKRSK